MPGLKCFMRRVSTSFVPGCASGGVADIDNHDPADVPTEVSTYQRSSSTFTWSFQSKTTFTQVSTSLTSLAVTNRRMKLTCRVHVYQGFTNLISSEDETSAISIFLDETKRRRKPIGSLERLWPQVKRPSWSVSHIHWDPILLSNQEPKASATWCSTTQEDFAKLLHSIQSL